MHNLISRLIVYKNINEPIFTEISRLFNKFENDNPNKDELIDDIYTQINHLLNLATKYGFNNNLWHNYLAYLIATTENPFTLISEKVGQNNGSVNQLVKHDLEIFLELFNYDFSEIENLLDIDCFSIITNYTAVVKKEQLYNKDVSLKVQELSRAIEGVTNVDEMFDIITTFYKKYGVGKYGLNRAFQLSHDEKQDFLIPITSLDDVVLDDLVGYEHQKKKLIHNTESFVKGKKANNVLLYGDAGTGKSTSIKAILNQYYPQGLRMIEVYKHETKYLPKIIKEIKNRNYKFIIYMDDLSFEESESEYKYLKALIEGGLETNPDNVLIYATSNRRHLIKETWNERVNSSSSEELYHSDTIREKLSLVDRFGMSIGYYKPTIKEYFNIVKTIARRYPEITLSDEELEREANKWLMNHGSPSGRTAEQLVYYLLGNY
ncbi:ATP-binding protein [Methanosphaera sp. ISO3-F5]|uniref:ATP-binding protein n=1 Tax=Methanosphaera sp. ISO3-F5 TaxID=1452353 RepID=UPI002B25A36D|nr:ATP-binding protein [Methanosphaera sp. ISO3-F5]WQH64364.1 ATP-binding protein [Methanosphaera sp. ISO3-F5]